MYKGFITCGLYLLFSNYAWAQPVQGKNTPVVPSIESQGTTNRAGLPNATLLEVLFATNEDCDLFINEELKGLLSKDQFRYVKLAPGSYGYRAKSKTTLDEVVDSFTVAEGKTNEIFIDLLYVVDE